MKPTTLAIISRVADHYEVTVDEILAVDRHKSVAEARQVAMWIVRKRSALSYPEIGREFKRDHTTVMTAVRRVDQAKGPMLDSLRSLMADVVNATPRNVGSWSSATGAREIDFGAVAAE